MIAGTSKNASAFSYFPNRVVKTMTLGHINGAQNSIVENTSLDSLGRLQIIARNVQIGSNYPVNLGFMYGTAGHNNGNLTQEAITTWNPNGVAGINVTQTFGYDAFDRASTAAEGSSWTQTYLYDQFGNRAVQAGGYIPSPYGTPTGTGQFSSSTNRWTGAGTGYDLVGDMTSIPGSLNEGFTYDAEYRVNAASANGTIDYVYDGEGRRVQKQATTFVTTYALDSFGKVAEEVGVPNPTTGSPIAESGTEYVEGDHLGDSRMLINDAGQVVRRWDYLPFGEQIPTGMDGRSSDYGPAAFPSTPDDVLKKFTGKERDAETGLDYFGARNFSSPMGRFVSADWAAMPQAVPYSSLKDPQSPNLYGYVRNSPLAKIDASGHIGLFGASRTAARSRIAGVTLSAYNYVASVSYTKIEGGSGLGGHGKLGPAKVEFGAKKRRGDKIDGSR
jgi:RHS repeat-associated protein